ncbi:hypothetical protein BGI27_16720 [Candidatus Dactylopiibacterium carminicum]|nr:hypothetical protein BGI27_16720 [Candidatus Dactylopiibacterium carminicum]PAS95645.1 MAG: hypothetical protein BSR46_16750 [Candidatus Dactylopiibacterium carminicum]
MTGELFAVLAQHSILGRLFSTGVATSEQAQEAFVAGINVARDGGPGALSHQLFAVRTLGLTGRYPGSALKDYLSGLLIGNELVSGLARLHGAGQEQALILIGDGALCQRYEEALAVLGAFPAAVLGNTAPAGLFDFARAAGLLYTRLEESAS